MTVGIRFVNLANANPRPATQIAPVVNVPNIQVRATISYHESQLWAEVNATYARVMEEFRKIHILNLLMRNLFR